MNNKSPGIISLIVGLVFFIVGMIGLREEEPTAQTAVFSIGGFILIITGVGMLFSTSTTQSDNESSSNNR